MESSLAEKQHAAAVEAYTRQCMKSHADAASNDGTGTRGRVAGVSRAPPGACRSNEQFAMSELTNSRELRPNNLVNFNQHFITEKFATKKFLKSKTNNIIKGHVSNQKTNRSLSSSLK